MVTTNTKTLYRRLLLLRNSGQVDHEVQEIAGQFND